MIVRPKPNALSWLWLAAAMIGLDQLTKWWALSALQPETPHPVIPGILNWTPPARPPTVPRKASRAFPGRSQVVR